MRMVDAVRRENVNMYGSVSGKRNDATPAYMNVFPHCDGVYLPRDSPSTLPNKTPISLRPECYSTQMESHNIYIHTPCTIGFVQLYLPPNWFNSEHLYHCRFSTQTVHQCKEGRLGRRPTSLEFQKLEGFHPHSFRLVTSKQPKLAIYSIHKILCVQIPRLNLLFITSKWGKSVGIWDVG